MTTPMTTPMTTTAATDTRRSQTPKALMTIGAFT
jgi:hypothetical protein